MAKKKVPSFIKEIQEYKPPEINYAIDKMISYSQVSMFSSCPKKWDLMYKQGYGRKLPTSNIHTCFGDAIHEAIQTYLNTMYNESIVKADELDIVEIFKNKLTSRYKEVLKKEYKGTHFSSATELREFYEDGKAILEWFKKKKGKYFSKRNTILVGVEIPVFIELKKNKNVKFKGFLDLVFYHTNTEEYTIIDIKTSTKGWMDYQKKDIKKTSQLILYKDFFSKQYNIDPKKIKVEYFIVKRKLWEESDFVQNRVQSFIPPSGKNKTTLANNLIEEFLDKAFNPDGSYKDIDHEPKPSKWDCTFCAFKDDEKLCGLGKLF